MEGHGDSPTAQTHAISVEPESHLHHSTSLAQDLSRVTVVAMGQLHMHFVLVKGCLPGEFIYPGRRWITRFWMLAIVNNLAMQLDVCVCVCV